MSLAQISAVPQSKIDWESWSFAHMANHRDIIRIINTAGTNGAITPTFTSVGGGDYELSGGVIGNAGQNYWQPPTAAWGADAANCGWYMSGVPAIQVEVTAGVITGVTFTPASSNPAYGYVTAAPNVGVTPGINLTTTTAALTEYPLYPLDLNYLGLWLYQHQVMHSQMDAILGIAGYNLLELDWTDPDQLNDWISFNVDEHIQACRILGIA